ncbi:MAG: helix-turn-helix transcriptional regulator [Campylobacteraceae bacterium]|jgi:transcriptional regulator with XRE-family HTH domain|nr:helix-turn-helix transcriptional regulator [Campylobacteraceae bacterium]
MSENLEEYSENVLNTVSANVKKYRELKGISQLQLALDIGMKSPAYLGRAELRKDNLRFNIIHLAKISKVLDIPIELFFEPAD